MTDQTTPLRDRIAEALYEHSHPGWAISFPDLDQEQRDTYLARADAVLAVLPAPADRSPSKRGTKAEALLLHFTAEAHRRKWDYDRGLDDDGVPIKSEAFDALHRLGEEMHVALEKLRRMADETATTETAPHRPVALATPCANLPADCTHSYNWHASNGDCQADGCPCRVFVPGERPEPVDPRRILGADPDFAAGARQDGAQPS